MPEDMEGVLPKQTEELPVAPAPEKAGESEVACLTPT